MFGWDDARFLLAVHRHASLSAAARQLGVNQSTVGRRLRAYRVFRCANWPNSLRRHSLSIAVSGVRSSSMATL